MKKGFLFSFIVFLITLSLPLFWLIYFYKKDPKREPKKLIGLCFFYGIIASLPILYFESFLNLFFKKETFLALIFFGFIEEFFKFFSTQIAVASKKEFDETIDPMIYLITTALGFAFIENLVYFFRAFFDLEITAFSFGLQPILRFMGANLLHAYSSGILGYFWAKSIITLKKRYLYLGFGSATLIHALFNFNIEISKNNLLAFLGFVLFFFFLALISLKKFLKSAQKL